MGVARVGRGRACAWAREGAGEAAAAAAAAAPSACSRCIFRVGGVMVTGGGQQRSGGGVLAFSWGQGVEHAWGWLV